LDKSLVNSHKLESGNGRRTTDDICGEVQTVKSHSDRSDITMLDKNVDAMEDLTNESDNGEMPLADIKQDIDDYIESNESKSLECNSQMSEKTKNVTSPYGNICDGKVCMVHCPIS